MILSIISGTYNRLPFLQAMVASARKSMPPNFVHGVDYEFVIADGGSTDGTLEWMMEEGFRIIPQGELLGAIKAFNAAGALAQGTYLVVANDDIEFEESAIKRGLAMMMDNPDVGAGCFYQDRAGRDWHVESMGVTLPDGSQGYLPYMQVGIIPKWLWDKCGGWGDWGGRTYGGDNYLSGKVYESGYKVVPVEGARISDKIPNDALRAKNYAPGAYGKPLWEAFPKGFRMAEAPIYPNPIPEIKRVLYAPIIEEGHHVQKEQKCGLREALKALGVVWEVDYVYSRESVAEAAKTWQPHLIVTQFHTAQQTSVEEAKMLRLCCKEHLVNWSGDVWSDQATPEFLEILRSYDLQLTVNAALLPKYKAIGIRAGYWQNSFEPPVIDNTEREERRDVVFLGNNYSGYRLDLAGAIKTLPAKVAIYGRGYPEGFAEGESLYNFRKTGQLYRGAKIAIADNQFLEATGFFSDRAWMILAAGGCLMMHQRVEGMEELAGLVAGVHYVEWNDVRDLKEKIAYYLENDEERRQIAETGTRECRANHSFARRVDHLKTLLATIPKKKSAISAMMIVKNEAHHILENLAQLEAFADEIIIVDTGSTDDTIAKIMGCMATSHHPVFNACTCTWRTAPPEGAAYADDIMFEKGKITVYSFPWADDFSAARNFAKSKCTKDWIFWLDADDRISPDMLESLKKNWPWTKRSLGITDPTAIRVFYHGDQGGNGCMQTRFFKNIPAIEWRGRAMETLDESLEELGIAPTAFKGKVITHLSEHDPVKQAAKQSRYIEMLKLESPSPRRDFNIAHCYASMGRWGDAFLWFRETEKRAPGSDASDFILFMMGYAAHQMGFTGLALECLERSEFPDAFYIRFLIEDAQGKERFDLLQKFLDAGIEPIYPTFAALWQPDAQKRLYDWHLREADVLAESVPWTPTPSLREAIKEIAVRLPAMQGEAR